LPNYEKLKEVKIHNSAKYSKKYLRAIKESRETREGETREEKGER